MCSVGISTEPSPKVSMVTVAQQTEDQHSLGAMATQNQIQIHAITKVKEVDMDICGLVSLGMSGRPADYRKKY